jgi:hypothetical protein
MLERNAGKTEHFGFLISAELEVGRATTEDVLRKLSDSLAWVEGIGEVDVECLGKIDVYEKEPDAIT